MPKGTRRRLMLLAAYTLWIALQPLAGSTALADEALYRYECNVLPEDPSAGWVVFDRCEPPCNASVQGGLFVLDWVTPGDRTNYDLKITCEPETAPPPTLWVEWRFRSNHPLGPIFTGCDASFQVDYKEIVQTVDMYGDAVISFDGGSFVTGLDMDAFHTFRFESLDGVNLTFAVDGQVFFTHADSGGDFCHALQLRGSGGCADDKFPNKINEWDFVRYGTIGFGERVISADPPSGLLDAVQHADLDRFAITFDQANFVYMDEITVEVTSGTAPVITQTWRRDNDEPDTLEVVLDAPLDTNALTRFIISDGVSTSIIEYSYSGGDFGACCQDGGICTSLTVDGCALIEGATYLGVGTECSDPAATESVCDAGACCLVGGSCNDSFRLTCEATADASFTLNATCQGDNNENGIDERCEEPIPAISSWGVVVLTIAILILGTLVIKRHQPSTA